MAIHKPKWFSDDAVMISTASTCGLTKGGRLLKTVDRQTGRRIQVKDPETGELVDAVDDQLLTDMEALERVKSAKTLVGKSLTNTLSFVPSPDVRLRCAVPIYYDQRYLFAFKAALEEPFFKGFSYATLGELIDKRLVETRGGHGSPSHEQRVGEVPYIKVSDLRAGLVNINPTNRVPRAIAEKFWRGFSSGLRAYDLICPERTSKNIGDFCILMPGQEQVLCTKEIIVLRPSLKAEFDQFYLLWAMTLRIVRDQWKRIVFMQTNREDVGKRYLEITIPVPPNRKRASEVSAAFREYYTAIAAARSQLQSYLGTTPSPHHFFVSGAEALEEVSGDDQVGDEVEDTDET